MDAETIEPVRVRIFPVKPHARSAAGLIEFSGIAEACEALVAANHTTIPNPGQQSAAISCSSCIIYWYVWPFINGFISDGKIPFSLKLSFSASPIIDRPHRGGDENEDK